MSSAYRNRPEFRPEVQGTKSKVMLDFERREGVDVRDFIIKHSAAGWTDAQIAKALGVRTQTLTKLWYRRLRLARSRSQVVPA